MFDKNEISKILERVKIERDRIETSIVICRDSDNPFALLAEMSLDGQPSTEINFTTSYHGDENPRVIFGNLKLLQINEPSIFCSRYNYQLQLMNMPENLHVLGVDIFEPFSRNTPIEVMTTDGQKNENRVLTVALCSNPGELGKDYLKLGKIDIFIDFSKS
jgi:hypothetical protein